MKTNFLSALFLISLGGVVLPLSAQRIDTTHITLSSPKAKAAVREVRLTGQLTTRGNSDFRQLRDLCWQLARLDLSAARVAHIPDNALHSRHRLQSVVLPEQLKSIGRQAFFACDSLQGELRIPPTVREVGTAAFSGCARLTEINLPADSLQHIGDFAFSRLTSLRRVRVGSAVPPVCAPTAFEGIDLRRVRLEVPRGSERAYRAAEGWKCFFGGRTEALPEVVMPVVIPQPALLTLTGGEGFCFDRKISIEAAPELNNERTHCLRILEQRTEARVQTEAKGARIRLLLQPGLESEAYRLSVSADEICIRGGSAAGVFYGLMTLDQVMASTPVGRCASIPQMAVVDGPRLGLRELMVDPARIFRPVDDLKAFIAEMARYKYNALHLHLVDDQAWRIEIKAFPRLVEQGTARVGMDDMQMPISGYYTQAEMRELVAFAARYHVQLIPEIELPGHEVAAIHCYPQLTCGGKHVPIRTTCGVSNELLCPGEPFVYEFLGKVFAELADIFPSPYVHLGGDEAGMPPLAAWTECDKCKALKRSLGIDRDVRDDNWQLQKHLFDRVIDTLRTVHGKTPMFWYETDFREIQPGCITFAWRHGLTEAAIRAAQSNGARIMLCPGEYCYFDYPMAAGDMPEVNWGMPINPLQRTYSLDPAWGMGNDFEKTNLAGVAGTLWSECINSAERVHYQAYPRALALAEVAWTPQSVRSWSDFARRLPHVQADQLRRGISTSLAW